MAKRNKMKDILTFELFCFVHSFTRSKVSRRLSLLIDYIINLKLQFQFNYHKLIVNNRFHIDFGRLLLSTCQSKTNSCNDHQEIDFVGNKLLFHCSFWFTNKCIALSTSYSCCLSFLYSHLDFVFSMSPKLSPYQ